MNKKNSSKILQKILAVFAVGFLAFAIVAADRHAAYALSFEVCPSQGATCSSGNAADDIEKWNNKYENLILKAISQTFEDMRGWLTGELFQNHFLPAMMLFTQQMTAVTMHQTMIIGMFLDAKQQLETQRLFQELEAQAHKDYHPSEDFCWFGTNVRSLAASEQLSHMNAVALDAIQMDRALGKANMASADSPDADKWARWKQFTQNYCDPDDNNRTGTPGTGLQLACPNPPANSKRINIDVDYTRAIDEPRTLDVNFTNGDKPTPDEQDVLALASNLYGNNVLTRNIFGTSLQFKENQSLYMALRAVAAKRSVAQNSFNAIVGLKSAGTQNGLAPDPVSGIPQQSPPDTSRFLGAILTQLGVPDDEVYSIIGKDPSYYAQLELLAKKIYQNPDFYSNLYDKPANIARKSVALKAIDLMLDRAIYESQLRQEMATSVLLSARLHKPFKDIENQFPSAGAKK